MGSGLKFLEKELQIESTGPAKGTILEVKEEKGLGTTLDTILYNGSLSVNDTIIIGGIDGAIITKVRALLEPASQCSQSPRLPVSAIAAQVNTGSAISRSWTSS